MRFPLIQCVLHSPVWVNFRGIEFQNFFCDTDDNGECFIDFKSGDVINGQVGLLECDRERNSGRNWEVDGLNTSIGVRYIIKLTLINEQVIGERTDNFSKGLDAELFCLLGRHQYQSGSTIVDGR